jgi:hypothetical protein
MAHHNRGGFVVFRSHGGSSLVVQRQVGGEHGYLSSLPIDASEVYLTAHMRHCVCYWPLRPHTPVHQGRLEPPRRIPIVEGERIVAPDLERRSTRLGYDVIGNVPTGPEAILTPRIGQPDGSVR